MKYRSAYYARQKTLSKTYSNMNKLCYDIEKWSKKYIKFKRTYKDFDYTIMINSHIPFNEDTFKKIESIYERFNKEMSLLCKENMMLKTPEKYKDYFKINYPNTSIDELRNFSINFEFYYNKYKKECQEVCKNKQELANYTVLLAYKYHPSWNKKFIWKVSSSGVLLNLEQKPLSLPMYTNSNDFDFEYLGKKYKMSEVFDIAKSN